ncbi:MAG: hypothetical protein ACFB02_07720 [Mastigocoleus sp.]
MNLISSSLFLLIIDRGRSIIADTFLAERYTGDLPFLIPDFYF